MNSKLKKIGLVGLSTVITGLLVYALITRTQAADWRRLIVHLNYSVFMGYLALYGLNLVLRTWRYQLLLRAAQAPKLPSFGKLTLVTMVRNMLVDFLPARIGSLSYVVILNRILKVDLAFCLASFTYAFIFDLLGLVPLLAGLVLVNLPALTRLHPVFGALALLLCGGALLSAWLVGPVLNGLGKRLDRSGVRWEKKSWYRKLVQQVRELGDSFQALRTGRVWGITWGLSILIRMVKYLMLALLLSAIIEAVAGTGVRIPWLWLLVGLIASEAATALPVGGLAGFGLYEGVLGSILAGQGIDPGQALLVSFAQHGLTQLVDYSLGGGALGYIFYFWAGQGKTDSTASIRSNI